MSAIQKYFENGARQIDIKPGEYEGPLIIGHSCTVDGHGATLWSKVPPALVVKASNVKIKNLRVESTTQARDFVAADVLGKDVFFEDVEVYGNIKGHGFGSWAIPRVIELGEFAANEYNEFAARLQVGESCRLINNVYGLKTGTQILLPGGDLELRMRVESMKDGAILYGNLLFETFDKIRRRIYVTGRSRQGAPMRRLPPMPSTVDLSPQTERSSVCREQRLPVPRADTFRVLFKAKSLPLGVNVDPYVFCLGVDNKVRRNTDLVSFENFAHETFGVYLDARRDYAVVVCPRKLPSDIQAVVVCFAICDVANRSDNNFSKITAPRVEVWTDDGLYLEYSFGSASGKLAVALEIYRCNGGWYLRAPVGACPEDLGKLCELYGLESM